MEDKIDKSDVSDKVDISDKPHISEEVDISDKPHISDAVDISDKANISDKPHISDEVDISDKANISGKPCTSDELDISDKPHISEEVDISDKAYISDKPHISDAVDISDKANISDKPHISDEVDIYDKANISEKPCTSDEVDISDKPRISDEVDISDKANISDKPHISDEVDISDKANISQKPCTSDEVDISDKPRISDEVDISDKANISDKPHISDEVDISDKANISEKPCTSDEVDISDKPRISDEVDISDKANISDKPHRSDEVDISDKADMPDKANICDKSNISDEADMSDISDKTDISDESEYSKVYYWESEDEEEDICDMLDDLNLLKDEDLETKVIDLSQLSFEEHGKAIICSDLSKNGELVVTGDQDEMAYVWNTNTGEIVLECPGHNDALSSVGFNYDDEYVATADMGGLVQVWSVKTKKLECSFAGDDFEWLTWHPKGNFLICGYNSGFVYVRHILHDYSKMLISSENSPSLCGKLLSNGKQLLVGYENGALSLWNFGGESCAWTNAQSKTIFNIDVNADETLAIVMPGSTVVEMSSGNVVCKLLADDEEEIEHALFNSELDIVITGSLSGQLSVWDLGQQTLRHQIKIECAITVLKCGRNGKIFVGTTSGAVHVYDVKSGMLIETLTGHTADIHTIIVFQDGNKILTTSEDATAKIFSLKTSK